jgi:hypothetical protein
MFYVTLPRSLKVENLKNWSSIEYDTISRRSVSEMDE